MMWVWESGVNPFWQQLWATFFGVLIAALMAWGTQEIYHCRARRTRLHERMQRQFQLATGLLNELVEIRTWLDAAKDTVSEHQTPPMFSPAGRFWGACQSEMVGGGFPPDAIGSVTVAYAALEWVMEGAEWLKKSTDDPVWVYFAQQPKYYDIFSDKRNRRVKIELDRIETTIGHVTEAVSDVERYMIDIAPHVDGTAHRKAFERMDVRTTRKGQPPAQEPSATP